MLTLRPMLQADLAEVGEWLTAPHVARWWLPDTTARAELDACRRSIAGHSPTSILIAEWGGEPIGWCQWYLWSDYPADAVAVGARPGEVGIDYALGEPSACGRGLGTALIAAVVEHVRATHHDAGFVSDPDAGNVASRRVLEKNGFALVAERPVRSEPTPNAKALYRRPGTGQVAIRLAGRGDVPALATLRAAMYSAEPPGPDFIAHLGAWFDAEAGRRVTWLAERADRPVGLITTMIYRRMPRPDLAASGWAYIGNLFVVPAERGAGIGRELIDEAIRYARAYRLARVVLHPSERARPLYTRIGFTPATELMSLETP